MWHSLQENGRKLSKTFMKDSYSRTMKKGTNFIAKSGHLSLMQNHTGLPLYIMNCFPQVAEFNIASLKSSTSHWCIMHIILSHYFLSVLSVLLFTSFHTASFHVSQTIGDHWQFIFQYYFSEMSINGNPSDFCNHRNVCICRGERKISFLSFFMYVHSAMQSGTDFTLI